MEVSRVKLESSDSSQLGEVIRSVRDYWDAYATGLSVPGAVWGSSKFFAEIKRAHDTAYAHANQVLNLNRLRGRALLELGCGIGLDTVAFARHGARVTALDLSPASLRLARRLLTYHGSEATLRVGNAENLPYSANSFDIVVARGLLMYTPNDGKIISEIVRVLKPGGEANILLHNRFSWYTFLANVSRANLYDQRKDPPVNRLYSLRQARQMVREFSLYELHLDRFPSTTKRDGKFAKLYNRLFVPITQMLPASVVRSVGFYIIIKAVK